MLGEGEGCTGAGVQSDFMMELAIQRRQREISGITTLFVGMLLFRMFMDLAYWKTLAGLDIYPEVEFRPIKYAISILWCVILFFGIRHTEKKASTFLLYVVYISQIIPISTIYGLCNENSLYYHLLCLAFLVCEVLVGWTRDSAVLKRNAYISKVMYFGFGIAIILVVFEVIQKNGMPSLTALNIFRVYELRGSGEFQISKYMNYLMRWSVSFLIPLFLAHTLQLRKYGWALCLCGMQGLLYLYSGHKTMLFAIPLVIICSLWSKREKFYQEIVTLCYVGFIVLCILSVIAPLLRAYSSGAYTIAVRSYSTLCRRVLIDPALAKFHYFEYFSTRPLMWLGGAIPRWLIDIPNPYETIDYQHEIGGLYWGSYETNAGTGFLAEGYFRFGFIGIFLILIIFAQILKWIDHLQDRIGYGLAVSIFVYLIYSLADGHLIDELFFGRWAIVLVFLIFCYGTKKWGENSQSRTGCDRLRPR